MISLLVYKIVILLSLVTAAIFTGLVLTSGFNREKWKQFLLLFGLLVMVFSASIEVMMFSQYLTSVFSLLRILLYFLFPAFLNLAVCSWTRASRMVVVPMTLLPIVTAVLFIYFYMTNMVRPDALVIQSFFFSKQTLLRSINPGIFFYVYHILAYSFFLAGVIYYLLKIRRGRYFAVIFIAAVCSLVLITILFGLNFLYLDLTKSIGIPPVSIPVFLTCALLLFLNENRGISGAAKFLKKLGPASIVTDYEGRILFYNGRAQALNTSIQTNSLLADQFDISFNELVSAKRKLIEDRDSVYELRLYSFIPQNSMTWLYLVSFHDVTKYLKRENSMESKLKEMEKGVEERARELQEANLKLKMEIADRRRAEEIISAALEEKNILIGEIHHRVKNNLQVIVSLLKLQKHSIEEEHIRDVFSATISRIHAISMVHEKLYKSEDLVRTNVEDYIKDLTRYLVTAYDLVRQGVNVNYEVRLKTLDIDRSILCGLIITELVSNSIKYAFCEKKPERKKINVLIHEQETDIHLFVSDNGSGFSGNAVGGMQKKGLGLRIIATLTSQLKGTYEFKGDEGTTVHIQFPRRKPSRQALQKDNQTIARIEDALVKLPHKIKDATILYYIEGRSISEAASILGIAEKKVEERLSTARRLLRAIFVQKSG